MGFLDRILTFAVDWAMDRLSIDAPGKNTNSDVVVLNDSKFKAAALEINHAIQSSTIEIIEKIESDKLELLGSRIRNLGDIIKLGDKAEILRYVFTVREVVDYAENRVLEGKKSWEGPFLMGKAAVFSALQACSVVGEDQRDELRRLCQKAKYDILDVTVNDIIRSGNKVPWDKVESFLTSRVTSSSNMLATEHLSNAIHPFGGKLVSVTFDLVGADFSIGKVLIAVRDTVKIGQLIFEIDAGKVCLEILADVEGVVESIMVQSGQDICSGAVLATIRQV